MSLDFQQVQQQVTKMGENAPERAKHLRALQAKALDTLYAYAHQIEQLREKVATAVTANPNLRCALPGTEALNHSSPRPPLPPSITIIAADGSQINPDRHAFVDYCLVNVGAIHMRQGDSTPPETTIHSSLLYDEHMYSGNGRLTESLVALRRDLYERQLLAELAQEAEPPMITLTDGPLELWVGRDSGQDAQAYKATFDAYLKALHQLHQAGASTAGYIDKPRGDLLVRLLEIALLPVNDLQNAGQRGRRRMLGITDSDLFREILGPGERSAIFGIQSRNAGKYADQLGLHFFYLNVGPGAGRQAYPVRVEIPAWVAQDAETINNLQAVLVHQCQILGSRSYPYLLHRSHEEAVVTQDDKMQVERMIANELHRRGIPIGLPSHKQAAKDSAGRTRM